MATYKHNLVCVREYTVPAQVLPPMRVYALCTGADLGEIPGSGMTIPEKVYRVGDRGGFSKKSDAAKWVKTGNWAWAS